MTWNSTTALFVLATGLAAGSVAGIVSNRQIRGIRQSLSLPARSKEYHNWVFGLATLAGGLLYFALGLFHWGYHWGDIPEVRPESWGFLGRLGFHALLFTLLIVAVATDFDSQMISDDLTIGGTVAAVLLAAFSQQFQIVHLWVDWNGPAAEIMGPYIPPWLDQYRLWHALSWSLAGLIVGAGITWGLRFVAQSLLGREALGMGDVTLMAMVGAFLGWQATVVAFFLAPLFGLIHLAVVLSLWRTHELPYGPSLAAGSVITLLFWSTIWNSTRILFGDPIGMATLIGIALILLVILLFFVRRLRGHAAELATAESSSSLVPPLPGDTHPLN